MNLIKELEKDPFDPDEFVERLAKHTIQVQDLSTGEFDIGLLHETFTTIIRELNGLLEDQMGKCAELETAFKEEESRDISIMSSLEKRNKDAIVMFHGLDERINYVAGKVIHLGDQLESVNTPRSKVVEAQKLMTYLEDLCNPDTFIADIFSDPQRVIEAAELILRLNSIATELPDDRFLETKKKISLKYDEVEKNLIEEFHLSHQNGDLQGMKQLAHTLVNFRGYKQCTDAFIEHEQSRAFTGPDCNIFEEAIPMCERNYILVKHIFPNPDQVMAKFVLNLFSLKLHHSIQAKLHDKSDPGRYLKTLQELYCSTTKTVQGISHFNLGSDENYLQKLTVPLFQRQLDDYIKVENKYLKDQCAAALKQYYEAKNHHKKQPNDTTRFQDLKRVIGTRTNLSLSQTDGTVFESFTSEELALVLLQLGKNSFERCGMLSKPGEVANNCLNLLETLLQQLLVEHVEYGIDYAMQFVSLPEGKVFPPCHFFETVRCTNSIVHQLEKLFSNCLVPLVRGSEKYSECLAKERYALEVIENKLHEGLNRTINNIVSWVKTYLQSEQRRLDTKPDKDRETLPSPSCLVIVQNIRLVCEKIEKSLDEQNAKVVLAELGVRFHGVILDNLLQNQFSTSEAVYAFCDVTEYKKCAEKMQVPLVTTLFETLQALWKILLVPAENLKQVCGDGQLADLDESVIYNFIQSRRDSKKLAFFRGM